IAVKFFLQKDIPEGIQKEVTETITTLGGRVESKVPRQGFILIRPGTSEAERLRLCWAAPDRPERYFVPYTYIEACKTAGMLLKQIFIENGAPISMHIHPSIANINVRNTLSQRIMHSGGDPYATPQSARVILADPDTDAFQSLVKTYHGVAEKSIESYLWVKKCIDRGALMYTPLIYKNPGGRRAGEERTSFTEDDEEHLCNWIALKIPFKEIGGRTGNKLYQQLCDLKTDPEYAWVTRHTWQSWRERYKKNAGRLDTQIALIVEQKQSVPGENGQYGYVRQPEEKTKRPRKKKVKTSARVDVAADEEDLVRPYHVPAGEPSQGSRVEGDLNDEDGSEWAIKIGNEPPPAWAKRKEPEDPDNEPSQKRLKTSPPVLEVPQAVVAIPGLHLIDQTIRDIAQDYRFTIEEVKEFYERTGDMLRTQARFRKMREALAVLDLDP
ncbi:hypothetical protein C8J56DRAFT_772374, partial [Mycena floridula]